MRWPYKNKARDIVGFSGVGCILLGTYLWIGAGPALGMLGWVLLIVALVGW